MIATLWPSCRGESDLKLTPELCALTRTASRTTCKLLRRIRELQMIVRGLCSMEHPILAHVVSTRRCNLACAYCNEFDQVSDPVPISTLMSRVDKLANLGTEIVTFTGGEPLLNPDLDRAINFVKLRGMIAGVITNGYLLNEELIERFNRAGLDHMQISIDNYLPDHVSLKSLKLLDRKLGQLSRHAMFDVNINSVLGAGVRSPSDAIRIAQRATNLGFTSTVGIVHDGAGQAKLLKDQERVVFEALKRATTSAYSRFSWYQQTILAGRSTQWRCRAGGRYLYICENGLVHYCSQQRGRPAKPLLSYTLEDVRRENLTEKPCAPGCTVSCVRLLSLADCWREPQRQATDCEADACGSTPFSAEKHISIATGGSLAEGAPLTARRHIGGSNLGL